MVNKDEYIYKAEDNKHNWLGTTAVVKQTEMIWETGISLTNQLADSQLADKPTR